MAELATIARPYADALFKAQSADLAGTAAWLDELAAVASNTQLLQFSENPKVTDAQVFDLISGVVKTTLPAAAQNFLRWPLKTADLWPCPKLPANFAH
jgi:F-type H+-transporting ATPase subunit delta